MRRRRAGKREHAWRWLEDASYVLAVGEHGPYEAHLLDLEVKTPIQFGERIMIVGSSEQLGNWDMQHGHELVWHEGHIWRGQVRGAVRTRGTRERAGGGPTS